MALLLVGPIASAQSDAELIDALATVTDRAEYDAVDAGIRSRVENGPPSQAFLDEIVRVATTSSFLGKFGRTGRLLKLVRTQGPYSEQSLVYVAEALGRESHRSSFTELNHALTESADSWPDAVLEILLEELERTRSEGRIWTLSAMPISDPRSDRVVRAMLAVLDNEEADYARGRTVRALGAMYEPEPLSAGIVDTLFDLAIADPILDNRFEALEVLVGQELDHERRERLGAEIHSNVMQPTLPENAELVFERSSLMSFRQRMADAFLELYDPPYPPFVVDFWISRLTSARSAGAVEVLQGAVEVQSLSDDQFLALIRTIDQERPWSSRRTAVMALRFPPLTDTALENAISDFASLAAPDVRKLAGYRLYFHYSGDGLPSAIVDIAMANLADAQQPGLIPISVALVSTADPGQHSSEFVRHAGHYADNRNIYPHFLSMIRSEDTDDLVMRYAGNASYPARFRYAVIQLAGGQPDATGGASPDVIELLDRIARTDDDTLLVQAAGAKLEALGHEAPARVALTNRDNQTRAMSIGFMIMLAINGIAFFVGLVGSASTPPNAPDSPTRLFGRLLLWLLLSGVVLVSLVVAFAGFIGHNSAPAPSWTFGFNMPAYFLTAIYVSVALIKIRRTRRQTLAPADG